MPLNPLENIPTLLARHIAVDKFFENFNELRMNEHTKVFPGGEMENINGLTHLSPSTYPIANLLKQAKVGYFFLLFGHNIRLVIRTALVTKFSLLLHWKDTIDIGNPSLFICRN